MRRRDLLKSGGMLALAPAIWTRREHREPARFLADERRAGAGQRVELNDVHSRLNATSVAEVVDVRGLDDIRDALERARSSGRPISIGGGRHAMGGQQFGQDTLHLDTRGASRLLSLDVDRGLVTVEAGIQWPDLIEGYLREQGGESATWGIAQKQTGADRLCVGGAVSANAHGRGLTLPPIVADVEAIELVDAAGELRTCSRNDNPELFSLAVGGYGLFGVLYAVTLRLKRRQKVRRVVEIRMADGLAEAFEERIADGFTYGDFQFETDEASPTYMRRGVLSVYEPVDPATPVPAGQARLTRAQWTALIQLAHVDKAEAYRRYSGFYESTDGQIYHDDVQQLGYYADEYHRALDARLPAAQNGTEMITELYVPRRELSGFLVEAGETIREHGASLIYGTVRMIEPDEDTFLAWARERFACTVMNLHVEHSAAGIQRAADAFRALIDVARRRGGSYFLTYHRWASAEQLLDCYPQMPEFMRLKRRHDPGGVFQSEWWRHHERLLRI